MKFLTEFLLFPFYVVLVLMFMLLVVLSLPLQIPFIKRKVSQYINISTKKLQKKKPQEFWNG